MVEIKEVTKRYVFAMKREYTIAKFTFDSLEEGSDFMFQALDHATSDIKFEVSLEEDLFDEGKAVDEDATI